MGLQVAIIGSGLMGHGIAQVFATAGHCVRITDADERVLSEAPQRISVSLVELGIEEAPVLARIQFTSSLTETLDGCTVVIEAVPEKIELKRALFKQIGEIAPRDALLATNTSSIPVTEIGRDLPDHARRRLVGLHWWNPPVLVPLVEVIRTEFVDPAFFDRAFELMRLVGKEPVKCRKRYSGIHRKSTHACILA